MDGDIELEIGSSAEHDEYTVRVVHAPAGGHASATFQLDVAAILRRRPELEATVLASAVSARRSTPIAELPVREVGQELFQALFTHEVYGIYRASLGAAQHSGEQLRVVLRLAAPELAAMPWEMLFDPETESYLCQTEPLLRHIPAPDFNLNPLDIVPPLRILGIVAAPRDLPGLDVDAEKTRLAQALAGPIAEGTIELSWASSGTWDDAQSKLLAGPWHVVHFIGHGDYDERTDEGRIALVGPDGRAAMVRAVRFMALLSVAVPRPRLVVLNSCSSGESGQEDLFSGTASTLVRSGISAVAAMQFAISDTAAIAFAHGFYAAIANGRGVDEAARVGRISVMASPDGTLEWATPALYVRGGSTQLFTLTGPPSRESSRAHVADSTAAPASGPAAPAAGVGGVLAAGALGPVLSGEGPTGSQPSRTQPDEATRLRILHAQLRALYVQAKAEMRARRHELAVELLDDLLILQPDYREAVELRAVAVERAEASRAYQAARAAQDAEDWRAAAEGFAGLESDRDFPDAAARRQDSDRRQRIADLQGELRFHSAAGSLQAVLDVAAELEQLDPASADPEGLTTAARAERDRLAAAEEEVRREQQEREEPAEREREAREQAERYQADKAATQQEEAGRANDRAAEAERERITQAEHEAQASATSQGEAERQKPMQAPALSSGWLTAGGAVMMLAGVLGAFTVGNLVWGNSDWWYSGGSEMLHLVSGLVMPAGYALLLAAGMPDRTSAGRWILGWAIASVALTGWFIDIESDPLTVAAIVFSVMAGLLGFWAGIRAIRALPEQRLTGWVLLVPLTLQPMIWVSSEVSFSAPIFVKDGTAAVMHFVIVALAGLLFIVMARRNPAQSGQSVRKEQPPWHN